MQPYYFAIDYLIKGNPADGKVKVNKDGVLSMIIKLFILIGPVNKQSLSLENAEKTAMPESWFSWLHTPIWSQTRTMCSYSMSRIC